MNCKMNKWKIDTPRDEVCNKYSSLSGFVRLTNSHEPYQCLIVACKLWELFSAQYISSYTTPLSFGASSFSRQNPILQTVRYRLCVYCVKQKGCFEA